MSVRVRIFNDHEIATLMKNPNIIGIKNKSKIIYRNSFKYWAVLEKLKFPEKTAKEIFETAGFDMNILNERVPRERLLYWIRNYNKFGVEYFTEQNKYRYKAIDNQDKTPSITLRSISDKTLIGVIEKNNLLMHNLINVIEKLITKL